MSSKNEYVVSILDLLVLSNEIKEETIRKILKKAVDEGKISLLKKFPKKYGGKTDSNRPKDYPKKPIRDYFYYINDNREELKNLTQKEKGNKWHNLSSKEKKPYKIMALKDKERYNEEYEEWIKNNSEYVNNKKIRKINAYNIFCSKFRENIKKEHPNEKISVINIYLSKLWKSLTLDEINKYYTEAAEINEKNGL